MDVALLDKLFTVKEVAELLFLTDSRVRQICRSLDLGTVAGHARFLSASEIETIREREKKKSGRPPKNARAAD
jgi:hypothetical protein